MFQHRKEAGQRLAKALEHLRDRDPVVLALPRGGVPVGAEVAEALGAPLDVVLVRKLGAPQQPELAAGAVVDGQETEIVYNEDVMEMLGIDVETMRKLADREVEKIEDRRKRYLRGGERASVEGRTAIVVDDGIATGATVRAALRGVRRRKPGHLVLAVPVAPAETVEALREEVDEVVCLETPFPFGSIGRFYRRFEQVEDDTVIEMLDRIGQGQGQGPGGGQGSGEP